AYVGSVQGVSAAGVSRGALLTGNGAEGAFRLNVLTGTWQPYATAGLGFTYYTLGDAVLSAPGLQSSGTVATFPLAVGLAWRVHGLVLDTRLAFQPATSAGLLGRANLSTWNANARVGFEI
ncbi:MAG: hypothetical protein JNK82_36720, partial [Myxococcaceae bacterium]|nr:hypothetical protein [Myxococcaceae bacterium]